jgi:hypothetical protein
MDELQSHFDNHDPQTQMVLTVISEETMGVFTIDLHRPEGKEIPKRSKLQSQRSLAEDIVIRASRLTHLPNYPITLRRIVSVVLLTGLLLTKPHLQSASADTQTYSLWSSSTEPTTSVDPDTSPIELGLKFRTDVDGEISAIRFYRGVPIDSGYTVHIWSATGELLGTGVAIEGQQPTPGWQTIQVYPPVAIKARQTYIASYYASKGQYAVDETFFTNASVDNGPLHALRDGEDGGNGVYIYGEGGGFPTGTYRASNYWIDVIFKPTTASSSYSIWNDSTIPSQIATFDPSAVELGLKFKSDLNGYITGIRFYKGSGNTGAHTATLWTSSGQLLATATFSNETASGWQQVNFAQPVAITANTVYVASYHTDVGNYAFALDYFATSGADNGPLHALRNGVSGDNGLYKYGTSGFPTNTYRSSNYFVDVVFTPNN